MKSQKCICGHQKWKHNKEGCNYYMKMPNECLCEKFEVDSQDVDEKALKPETPDTFSSIIARTKNKVKSCKHCKDKDVYCIVCVLFNGRLDGFEYSQKLVEDAINKIRCANENNHDHKTRSHFCTIYKGDLKKELFGDVK